MCGEGCAGDAARHFRCFFMAYDSDYLIGTVFTYGLTVAILEKGEIFAGDK
ncbi:MAG: hypothetical protein K2N55_07270 [Lachnospiraceae bacterium]|nr:hypothetical protein [Lachnospiraceae bacterium]